MEKLAEGFMSQGGEVGEEVSLLSEFCAAISKITVWHFDYLTNFTWKLQLGHSDCFVNCWASLFVCNSRV